ncbi:hypothetical protein [Ekhidna sp.]|uniref:hypothetical protein n=1 Tax=Ekhidna sp. TaxID=2608089 RepID=UPI003BAD300B
MKPHLLILIGLFSLLSFSSQSQVSEDAGADTVLKIKNPYKKSQTKWLNKKGFKKYNWNDPAINLHLDKALDSRYSTNFINGLGVATISWGLLHNALNSMLHQLSDDWDKGDYKIAMAPYVVGGALVGTALIMNGKTQKELKKAKKLYRAGY